jgi:hypothetical protein
MNSDTGSFQALPEVLEREAGALIAALWTAMVEVGAVGQADPPEAKPIPVWVRAGEGSRVVVKAEGSAEEVDVAALHGALLAQAEAFAVALNRLVRHPGMGPHGGLVPPSSEDDEPPWPPPAP